MGVNLNKTTITHPDGSVTTIGTTGGCGSGCGGILTVIAALFVTFAHGYYAGQGHPLAWLDA